MTKWRNFSNCYAISLAIQEKNILEDSAWMRQYFKGANNLSMFRCSWERIWREGEMENLEDEEMEGVRTLRVGRG